MGATVGPNIGLSEIGSIIVRKIADNADLGLVAKSTEETIQKIEAFNARRLENNLGLKKLILASMDIEKFSPNILSEGSAKVIRGMWEESELEIEVDGDNLSKYLGVILKEEEVVEEGFEDLLYTKEKKDIKKKRKVTKKIGRKYVHNTSKQKTKVSKKDMDISDEGADTLDTSSKKQNDSKKKKTVIWNKPKRIPTKLELRKMFGKALEGMLIVCMNNHVYQFENITRLQKQGGPIGLRLTGEIADCLMINWDKKLLTKLESHGMIPELYTRFKDDIAIVIESLEKGSKLVEDTITVDEI